MCGQPRSVPAAIFFEGSLTLPLPAPCRLFLPRLLPGSSGTVTHCGAPPLPWPGQLGLRNGMGIAGTAWAPGMATRPMNGMGGGTALGSQGWQGVPQECQRSQELQRIPGKAQRGGIPSIRNETSAVRWWQWARASTAGLASRSSSTTSAAPRASQPGKRGLKPALPRNFWPP